MDLVLDAAAAALLNLVVVLFFGVDFFSVEFLMRKD